LAFARSSNAADAKPLRGIFPIVQTPFTESGAVDYGVLEQEIRFLARTGVHGVVWPQLASQYSLLTYDERIRGAETIMSAGRSLRPAVVIGVQAGDATTAVRYARHAAALKPDAIIALPPVRSSNLDLEDVRSYYSAIAGACDLPLFIQTAGNMSVDFLLRLATEIPTIRFIKDEAGETLSRISDFEHKKNGRPVAVFTGAHGRTFIDELMRGAQGTMPVAGWVDLYVKVWDAWQANDRPKALDLFSKLMLFVTQTSAFGVAGYNYVLYLRGVFPNWNTRGDVARLDDLARESLRQNLDFVRPWLTTATAQ